MAVFFFFGIKFLSLIEDFCLYRPFCSTGKVVSFVFAVTSLCCLGDIHFMTPLDSYLNCNKFF